jgi:hypothetical protein
MMFNPHKLGIHKILSKIPLNAIFDAPYKAQLKRAVNIADLRLIAKARAHKVSYTLSRGADVAGATRYDAPRLIPHLPFVFVFETFVLIRITHSFIPFRWCLITWIPVPTTRSVSVGAKTPIRN